MPPTTTQKKGAVETLPLSGEMALFVRAIRLLSLALVANGILSRLNRTPEGLAAEAEAVVKKLEEL